MTITSLSELFSNSDKLTTVSMSANDMVDIPFTTYVLF